MRKRELIATFAAAFIVGGISPVTGLAQNRILEVKAGLKLSPPPTAPVRPVVDDYHGTKVVDPYRYMEDLKDPEVQGWMRAQADYARAVLDALPGRAALRERMGELRQSTPELVHSLQIVAGRYYTLRLPATAQQPKLYVREGVHGSDRLLIDPETLPGGNGGLLAIQWFSPSPDNRYVAYTLTAAGSEEGVLHVLDTQADRTLPEIADRAGWGPVAWLSDSRSFFYSRLQLLTPGMPAAAKYQNIRVYLHELGRTFDDDPVVLGRGTTDAAVAMTQEESPIMATGIGTRYAIAIISPSTDPSMRVYAASLASIRDGRAAWRAIAPRYDNEFVEGANDELAVALHGDVLYWLSRKDAPRGQVLALDLARPDSKPRTVVAEGTLPISQVYAGRDALYWRESDAGINRVHRLAYSSGARRETLQLPYAADITNIATDLASDAVVLAASSWVRSNAYLSVDRESGRATDDGLQPAGPHDRADDLVAEEVRVRSWDGTLVPLSIVYGKGLARDGSHPAILDGYGAYGTTRSPFYNPVRRAFFERGVVLATCHVRGGGEYGDAWHRGGFQETKPNTWKDFIACAEFLVAHGYTSPDKLSGTGGSAGGILIGRAIEERPDLFASAVLTVPVADALRFETTANGPGNVAEFGSIETERGFRALHAMSPYANVVDGTKYPAVLVTTGINDPRVAAWGPAKLAARLQAATASGKPVLLHVDYGGGHGVGRSTDQYLDTWADFLSFVLWQTGHPDFQSKP